MVNEIWHDVEIISFSYSLYLSCLLGGGEMYWAGYFLGLDEKILIELIFIFLIFKVKQQKWSMGYDLV